MTDARETREPEFIRDVLAKLDGACDRHGAPCIKQRSIIISALKDARASALNAAARRIDDSESETWSRDEIRDWLSFQATSDVRAEGRREQERETKDELLPGSTAGNGL